MKTRQIFDRIEINPQIMLGKPVIKGTRIPVYLVLNLLAEGQTPRQVCKDYPDLTAEDIRASINFGSVLALFGEAPLSTQPAHHG